jgi:hypothetical protein
MTRTQAQTECERLAREHPDRERYRWFPRRAPDGEWGIARVPALGRPKLRETVAPPPPTPREEDHATVAQRHLYWVGGA